MNRNIIIYIYDSRSTMNPVQGMNVRLQKDDEGFSIDSATNDEGKVVFNVNHEYDLIKLTLDNDPTWVFEYILTEPEQTFIYYKNDRGII